MSVLSSRDPLTQDTDDEGKKLGNDQMGAEMEMNEGKALPPAKISADLTKGEKETTTKRPKQPSMMKPTRHSALFFPFADLGAFFSKNKNSQTPKKQKPKEIKCSKLTVLCSAHDPLKSPEKIMCVSNAAVTF